MSTLIPAHGGGELRPRLLSGEAAEEARARARTLPRLRLSSREAGDLIMLGIGGYTPLEGFMDYADWLSVCRDLRTASGLFWPIPITLSTDAARAESLAIGRDVALEAEDGELMGILRLTEKYRPDRRLECREVFRTTDPEHPGVGMVMSQGEINLAGPVQVLSQGEFPRRYPGVFLTPEETRAAFEARGWRRIAAFQTRNPMHRSHEYLVKLAVEICDGVLIHSLLGRLKPGDIPAPVRIRAIQALVAHHFVPGTVIQAGYPLDMRYAGPREALLHAVFRQNYGCTDLIVGRDHAGVGDYYGPYDAQRIFDEIPPGALQIRPLKVDWTFWCRRCEAVASARTCPHGENDRLLLSGSKLRKLLSEGRPVPPQFSRPEVLEILREYYAGLGEDERVTVRMAGHSAR